MNCQSIIYVDKKKFCTRHKQYIDSGHCIHCKMGDPIEIETEMITITSTEEQL